MDANKRLERLHKELEELDRKEHYEKRKALRTKSNKLATERLIAFYIKCCRISHQKEDEYFMHCLRNNRFELNVSRMQSAAESEDDGDSLSSYLKVLKHRDAVSSILSVSIIDDSDKIKSSNKQVIGSRIAIAFYKFLKMHSPSNHSKSEEKKRKRKECSTKKKVVIPMHSKLESIELRGIRIETKRHWQMLSEAMSKVSSLRTLSLHNMPLHDEGADVLCCSLRKSVLNRLSLSQCGLTVDSAQSLSRLIMAHSNTRNSMEWQKKLRVNGQSLGNYNESRFDPKRTGLTAIDLSQNQLTDDGVQIITKALIHDDNENGGILWIDLRANKVTKRAVIDVIKMLKRNTKILHFDLTSNHGIPQNIVLEIFTILGLRRTQNAGGTVIDSKLMGKTRDFNAKQTTTPRISYKSSRIQTVRPSLRNSVKSTPKIKKSTSSKAMSSKKAVKRRVISDHRHRASAATKRVKAKKSMNSTKTNKFGMKKKRKKTMNGLNANEMLRDILSEYQSTKMECNKLTKQKETISQIIDSLESTFHRFNEYIDSIESQKRAEAVSMTTDQQMMQSMDSNQGDAVNALQSMHSVESQIAHNVIEQRLRQIWDSRLTQTS